VTGTVDTTVRGYAPDTTGGPWLGGRRWDRIFILGGALLVPLPPLLYYLLHGSGIAVSASEDLVTAFVMLTVGGPHVFATYTRTYLEPGFFRRSPTMAIGGLAVAAIVIAAVLTSAFLDVRVAGYPPIQFVLTFFFFWAGVHVMHQMSYCVRSYGERTGTRRRRDLLDYAVLFACLFPVAFFRMSMIDPAAPDRADPDALATRIVVEATGSSSFADDYVFRIGRVHPILPDFVRHDAFWIFVLASFVVLMGTWLWKCRDDHRRGRLHLPTFYLVGTTAVLAFMVPLVPNLDASFQGLNAWHSFQYLGIVYLWNRTRFERGEIHGRFARSLAGAGRHWRFYGVAVGVTVLMVAVMFGIAFAIESGTDGHYRLFGHDEVPLGADGRPDYRPGALLLAYYVTAFSMLLVHYLHDGCFFLRNREIQDA